MDGSPPLSHSPVTNPVGSESESLATTASYTDKYAEWDDESTIAAIEEALCGLGQVVRLEADASFPDALREASPDIVFNVAEGMGGVSRESFVPSFS